ncbi:hypothetical protein [Streptomyces sp. NPDC058326]|uniref:hypothetical protein n=1 Tax=Streptomyces sp. NPDC058326 TaxID=3346447 RepID=UPI0036E8367B
MMTKQTYRAACAVAALAVGAVACTADGELPADRAKNAAVAEACENGTYTWFNVDERDVLTAVAPKQTLGEGGGTLTHRPTRLHTPRTAVTVEKGPRVDTEAALRSLGVHIGDTDAADTEDYAFADVRRPAPRLETSTTSVQGGGTFVDYAFVRQVTGDFRYTCGSGEPARGRAISWTIDGSGVLECSEVSKGVTAEDPALTAARMSCGPGAPAARTAKAVKS